MITTVTTITTVTAIVTLGLATAISIAAVITAIIFLTTRELASASNSRVALRIAKFASVGILPLVLTFAVIVAVEIAKIL
ncbi:MAG: hypothetical protein ABIH70_01625 [Chloroflexota bacterium]